MPRASTDDGGKMFLDLALELVRAKNYVSFTKLAQELGCGVTTVYRYYHGDKEFHDAFRASRQAAVEEIKQHMYDRALGNDGKPSSDMLTMYALNNFDEEIVERMQKQKSLEISININVPAVSESIEGWGRLVEEAEFKQLPDGS